MRDIEEIKKDLARSKLIHRINTKIINENLITLIMLEIINFLLWVIAVIFLSIYANDFWVITAGIIGVISSVIIPNSKMLKDDTVDYSFKGNLDDYIEKYKIIKEDS